MKDSPLEATGDCAGGMSSGTAWWQSKEVHKRRAVNHDRIGHWLTVDCGFPGERDDWRWAGAR